MLDAGCWMYSTVSPDAMENFMLRDATDRQTRRAENRSGAAPKQPDRLLLRDIPPNHQFNSQKPWVSRNGESRAAERRVQSRRKGRKAEDRSRSGAGAGAVTNE